MADPAAATGPLIFDVGDADFEAQVIERSKTVPVIVDFWAPWCGPCRALGPLLERLTAEQGGAVALAKVNIDENPGLANAFRVQSIPMVVGVRDGGLAAHFVGAQPEPAVREFLARLLPSQGERQADEAEMLLAAGRVEEAERESRAALELEPDAPGALVTLAKILAERGEDDEALALLERVDSGPKRQEADRLAAAIRIRQSGAGDEAGLRERVEANPGDLEARFALAQAMAAAGGYEEALDHYLEIVKRDRGFRDDGGRKAMLDIFDLLGPGDELADRFRSELAKVLFR
jgi:putative thioredoxin